MGQGRQEKKGQPEEKQSPEGVRSVFGYVREMRDLLSELLFWI